MINSILILAICGSFGSILIPKRGNRMIGMLSFLITAAVFFILSKNYLSGTDQIHAFSWLKYMSLQVDIDLSANARSYNRVFPVYVLSLLSMLIANFNPEENKKQRFCSLVMLNICAITGAVCAVNLLQLLICSCLITVLGFCTIDDMDARKKYAFYNLLSDLSLFSVCSLAYGYIGSLEFSALPKFDKLGAHRDLVAVLLAFSVCLKLGLFMFHNQLYDLSVLNFNRLSYVLFCSAPFAGLIILYKFYPLMSVSDYAEPLLKIMTILTLLCGIYTTLVIDNIKEKAIGFAQILTGIGLMNLLFFSAKFETVEQLILFGGYLFVLNLFFVYHASSHEMKVSQMGGFISGTKFGFGIITVSLFALVHYILITQASAPYVISIISAGILILISSHIFRQIFFGTSHADERIMALLKNPTWYMLISLIVIGGLLGYPEYQKYQNELLVGFLLFILFLFFYPLRRLEQAYANEKIQESDVFESIFDFLIITPLTILGRILWLLVDFILIERTLINSISKTTAFLINNVTKLNVYSGVRYFMYVILSVALIFLIAVLRGK